MPFPVPPFAFIDQDIKNVWLALQYIALTPPTTEPAINNIDANVIIIRDCCLASGVILTNLEALTTDIQINVSKIEKRNKFSNALTCTAFSGATTAVVAAAINAFFVGNPDRQLVSQSWFPMGGTFNSVVTHSLI